MKCILWKINQLNTYNMPKLTFLKPITIRTRQTLMAAGAFLGVTILAITVGTTALDQVNNAQANGEKRYMAYTTGYTYYDNTPVDSAVVSHPVLHTQAGGTGTYADPITVAVGHDLSGGIDRLDYPSGTRFYVPNVRRYFIVEDTCGDGASPQNGPCHTGYPASTSAWLDLWIDGRDSSREVANDCLAQITDANGEAHLVIENPAANYLVTPGAIIQNGTCTQLYGDLVVAQ